MSSLEPAVSAVSAPWRASVSRAEARVAGMGLMGLMGLMFVGTAGTAGSTYRRGRRAPPADKP